MTATDVKAVIVFTSAAGKLGRSVAKNLADGYRIVGLDRRLRVLCVVSWRSHRIRSRDARLGEGGGAARANLRFAGRARRQVSAAQVPVHRGARHAQRARRLADAVAAAFEFAAHQFSSAALQQ